MERIEFVVDVRSFPYSRHASQFNREELQDSLRTEGVRYVFLGEELGGRPSTEDEYDEEGHALYWRMAQAPQFKAAVDRLVSGARQHRIALACSEGDPQECHRRLLVGKVLSDRGVELRHILRDGSVAVETSVDVSSTDQPSLFGEDVGQWRSTRSVSQRRRLSASSPG